MKIKRYTAAGGHVAETVEQVAQEKNDIALLVAQRRRLAPVAGKIEHAVEVAQHLLAVARQAQQRQSPRLVLPGQQRSGDALHHRQGRAQLLRELTIDFVLPALAVCPLLQREALDIFAVAAVSQARHKNHDLQKSP